MPCARKKASLFAKVGGFIVLAIALFFAIYLKNSGVIPSEGLIEWLINYIKALSTGSSDWVMKEVITLIIIIAITFVAGFFIYFMVLRNNKR